MGELTLITIVLIIAGIIAAGIVVGTLLVLGVKQLKQVIKKHQEKNKRQKVVFGKTEHVFDKKGKEIIDSVPSMTMEELDRLSEAAPYFVADYDEEADEIVNVEILKPDSVETKVDDLTRDSGIVIFD